MASSNNNKRMELLDKALEGKPAEAKARVLNLLLRMGIDPEDEFFLIFIAIGQLQVLIEDSPRDWQDLFTSFEGELRQWESRNVQTLAQLSQQASLLEGMASNSEQLTNILQKLVEQSTDLVPHLREATSYYRLSTEDLKVMISILDDNRKDFRRLDQLLNKHQQTNQAVLRYLDQIAIYLNNQGGQVSSISDGPNPFLAAFLGSFLAGIIVFTFVISFTRL